MSQLSQGVATRIQRPLSTGRFFGTQPDLFGNGCTIEFFPATTPVNRTRIGFFLPSEIHSRMVPDFPDRQKAKSSATRSFPDSEMKSRFHWNPEVISIADLRDLMTPQTRSQTGSSHRHKPVFSNQLEARPP